MFILEIKKSKLEIINPNVYFRNLKSKLEIIKSKLEIINYKSKCLF